MDFQNFPIPINTDAPIIMVCNPPHSEIFQIGDVLVAYFKQDGKNYIASYPENIRHPQGAFTMTAFCSHFTEQEPEQQQAIPFNQPVYLALIRNEEMFNLNVKAYDPTHKETAFIGQPLAFYLLEDISIGVRVHEILHAPYVAWRLKQNPVVTFTSGQILKKSMAVEAVGFVYETNKSAPNYRLKKYYTMPLEEVPISLADFGIRGEFVASWDIHLISGLGTLEVNNQIIYKPNGDVTGNTILIRVEAVPLRDASIETPPYCVLEITVNNPVAPYYQTDSDYFDLLDIDYEDDKLTVTNTGELDGEFGITALHKVDDNLQVIETKTYPATFDEIEWPIAKLDGYIMFEFLRMGKRIGYMSYKDPEPVIKDPIPDPTTDPLAKTYFSDDVLRIGADKDNNFAVFSTTKVYFKMTDTKRGRNLLTTTVDELFIFPEDRKRYFNLDIFESRGTYDGTKNKLAVHAVNASTNQNYDVTFIIPKVN